MLKEIIVWPSEEDKGHQKGKFFEKLTNHVFITQRYKVSGNVNVTGQEFDLECTHMDRVNEKCLVECKAKQNLSSDEIKKFVFSVEFNKFNFGYFLYTRNYEHQVSGLIKEIESDQRYKNLYFWGADKVIELLVASNSISEYFNKIEKNEIFKVILLYSHFGVFYITIIGQGTIPERFFVNNAKDMSLLDDATIVTKIKNYIDELNDLDLYEHSPDSDKLEYKGHSDIDSVTEIQSSDSWDDYKPASLKYFVGRRRQKESIFAFLNEVRTSSIEKRVFYIDGKSGWGKSSLMSDLRERCRNQHYKNKYFSVVIDSRSANSNNFVALAFELLIKKAVKSDFIPEKYLSIKIPSSFDILSYSLTEELSEWLKSNSRVLILVFDQFEDVFRKDGVFKSFYKFLLDVNNLNSNIALGFSWKSEVNIPIENEAYHLWQQSRDLAFRITLDEFDASESKAIIKQLEKDISANFDKYIPKLK